MLDIEQFPPPDDFRKKDALVTDESMYEEAAKDLEGFWQRQADELIDWAEKPTQTLDESNAPFYKWFADGKLNVTYNCLDRHVEAGNGDRVAFHWRGEEGEERDITYAELHGDVQRFANALKARGIGKGDVVGIYLPMIPEVLISMLACARIGAPHNVVFGGFSPEAVRERMEFSDAKALITVDGARRKGKTAPIKSAVDEEGIGDLDSIETIFVVKATGTDCEMKDGRDVWFAEEMETGRRRVPARAPRRRAPALRPLHLRLDREAEGRPAHHRRLPRRRHLHPPLRLRPEAGDQTSSGVAPTSAGSPATPTSSTAPSPTGRRASCTRAPRTIPDKDVWWDIIERYKVTILYTAPTAIRACMKWGVEYPAKHDLSSLRLLGTVGEPINPKAWLWYYEVIGGERCPIVDTWWQTETGHILISPLPGLTPAKPGSATKPLPGIDAAVLDDDGKEVDDGQGLLALRRPWPGMLRTLFKEDDRFKETYYSKWDETTYFVGDAARKDEDGYFWILGRVDDVVNVSGHRLSTAEVESAIVSHPKVAECAVIGIADEDTGQAICAFVTLEGDLEGSDEMARRRSTSTSPSGSRRSPGPSASSGPTTCPRPAPARSCAGSCATSVRTASSATSPRSATRR